MNEIKEIFERVYDDPANEDGTKKPNKSLGVFELIDGDMNDYSYQVYLKGSDGKLYKLIGREVSGYYHKNEGGTKHELILLEDTPDVSMYKKFLNSHYIAKEKVNDILKDAIRHYSKHTTRDNLLKADGIKYAKRKINQAIDDLVEDNK